ncbi:hypothetical protein [Rhodococcus jostii]|uniref:hypothetical protein n=1 Tax=Rhodococcus jostii TaxID=132919 RepID=UPI00362A0B29
MPLISTNKNRPHRMRRWAYVPLVAVVAGAVCAGAGIGSAATDTDAGSGDNVEWRVHNYTDKALTSGIFFKEEVDVSSVDITGLKPGEVKSGIYQSRWEVPNITTGHVCFNNTLWYMDTQGTPEARWRDVYVFFRGGQLFVTPEGALDNRIMKPAGPCSDVR